MMRLSTLTAAAALAAFAASPAAAAVQINNLNLADVNGDVGLLPTSVSGSENFDTVTNEGKGYTGSNGLSPQSTLPGRRDPYDDPDDGIFDKTGLGGEGKYIVLGSTHGSNDTTTAFFDISGGFLDILWGSPDDGTLDAGENQVIFNTTSGTETVDGSDIIGRGTSALGEGEAYVRLTPEESFNSFELVQFKGGPAMEASLKAVPLPAAAWLMIGGLGAVGAYARRSRKAAPTA